MDTLPQLIWLQAFISVAENLGFTNAAWKTGISTMLLSKRCRQLEAHLEHQLFHRTTRKVELTEFGHAYLPQCRALLEQAKVMSEWAATSELEPVGRLRIAVDPVFLEHLLCASLPKFQSAHPKVCLSVVSSASLLDADMSEFDLAIGYSEYLGLRFGNLKRKKLLSLNGCILAAPTYLENTGTPKTPMDLEHHYLIGDGISEPSNLLMVADGPHQFEKTGLSFATPTLSAESSDIATRLTMAIAGQGLMSSFEISGFGYVSTIRKAIDKDQLVEVLPEYKLTNWMNYLYVNPARSELSSVRAFITFLDEVLEDYRH